VRFRTNVLLAMVLLVVGIVAATVFAATAVIDHSARADLAESLMRDRQVFEDLQKYRQTLFQTEIRVVAEEPRLKAVAATEDITHETVLGVARELQKAVGCDVFLITDGEGRLLADVADPTASGYDMTKNPLVKRALADSEAADLWTDAKSAYQMQARRLDFGKTIVGVLVIGYRLDDAVAQTISRQTGSSVLVQMAGSTIAQSMPGETLPASEIDAALAPVPAATPQPVELSLHGSRYVAMSSAFPDYHGERALRYVVLRSLDRALAPRRALTNVLYMILAAATVLALMIGLALSRRLSRPIDDLVRFTVRIAKGDLAPTSVSGPAEVRTLGEAMNRMVVEILESRDRLAAQEQLRKELEIAAQIQTSIVPHHIDVPGLHVAARMVPAADVGGDYYDFVPMPDGCWMGVGDVAGHGLTAGLIMMMIQSVVASLARANPNANPRDLVSVVNAVMFDNIRARLKQDEHVTFSLIRFRTDGSLVFAGAHEEMIVCPADGGPCRRVSTPGTWLGAVHDIEHFTTDSSLKLANGDLLVLYTDGVTETMDGSGEMFGIDRLCQEIEAARAQTPERIRDRVLDAVREWGAQTDDVTLVVMRYGA